jgi:hypothetical protein
VLDLPQAVGPARLTPSPKRRFGGLPVAPFQFLPPNRAQLLGVQGEKRGLGAAQPWFPLGGTWDSTRWLVVSG